MKTDEKQYDALGTKNSSDENDVHLKHSVILSVNFRALFSA